MDAKRSSMTGLASRRHGSSTRAALHLGEIFKKTPYAAGLKPHRRDAAKDLLDSVGTPLPMTPLNVKLTGAGRAKRKTKWKVRQTNPMSGALVTHRGRAHEKQCYADS